MRKTKIRDISLPHKTEEFLSDLQKKMQMTRSELVSYLIKFYQNFNEISKKSMIELSDEDLNKVLKMYYKLIGYDKKKILVIGLGIIEKRGKVLIGKRKRKDKYVRDLSWVFPGGRLETIDFDKEIKREVKEETNLCVRVCDIVHARLIPDSPRKKVRVVALYFHLKPTSRKIKASGDLSELKWVKSTEVCKYFTTSTADEVIRFLGSISK